MNKNPKLRKALTLILCAVALIAISVGATIAYLTDNDSVTNTFEVGQVHINLDEAKTDENGVKQGETRTETGNKYKLMPGHTYTKDPTVTVEAGSSEAYVRMLVTVNNMADLKAIFPSYVENGVFLLQKFVAGWDSAKWPVAGVVEDTSTDTCTYEFRYYTTTNDMHGTSNTQKLEALFTSFTLPGSVTNDQIKALSAGYNLNGSAVEAVANAPALNINVVAHAIQKDGFDIAEKAWAAFATDNP